MRENPIRLAAVAAGPVFYQAPLYQRLASDPRVELTVVFASSGGVRPYNAGFGELAVSWDVDTLAGYRSEFLAKAAHNDVLAGFFALSDWDVVRRIWTGGYDVLWVHGYSYFTLWLAMATALLGGIPILLREEQTLLHPRRGARGYVRAAVLRVLFRLVRGLYIGSNNRAFFRHYGMRDERLFPAPYCVDNDFFQREADRLEPHRDEVRRSFGIGSDNGPVVLFVGKFTQKKQPLVALEAFRRVRERHRCALLLVGAGELEEELRAQISIQGIRDVHFSGFLNRSEISTAYAAADMFILPSAFHETWGLVVNEAMNFGLPVVVSDRVGCGVDLVKPGANGYVVDYRNADGFATVLEGLVANPSLRARMGRRSRDIIGARHYGLATEGIIAACQAAGRAAPPHQLQGGTETLPKRQGPPVSRSAGREPSP